MSAELSASLCWKERVHEIVARNRARPLTELEAAAAALGAGRSLLPW